MAVPALPFSMSDVIAEFGAGTLGTHLAAEVGALPQSMSSLAGLSNITKPTSITITGGSASDTFDFGQSGSASVVYDPTSAARITIVGGTTPYTTAGGYTFSWALQSGTGLSNTSTTGETFTLSRSGTSSGSGTESWRLTMTNAAGSTTSNTFSTTITLTELPDPCWDFSSLVWKLLPTGIEELTQIGMLSIGDYIRSFSTPSMVDESVEGWENWQGNDVAQGTDGYSQVTRIENRPAPSYYRVNDEENITGMHPFMIGRNGIWQWIRVQDFQMGDLMYAEDGSTIPITSNVHIEEPLMVTILGVENVDTYFAGQFGGKMVLSHNK